MIDLVIGSGPAGVSVATALLARGRKVLMLDGGKALEPDLALARDDLARRSPERWSKSDRTSWQEPQHATPPGQVRRFGSDFAMEPAAATFSHDTTGLALRSSRASGGLSNLWGSAVLPYRPEDMAGWPVTAAELAPHYAAVAGFLPIAGRADALENLFPALPMQGRTPLPFNPQAEVFLTRMASAQKPLAAIGITVGAARQAVGSGCRTCGMCLHGCPWGLIWSARGALDHLRTHPNFSYRPGAIVTSFAETANGVTLSVAGGETLLGTRAFVAAGVLETARILLASLPALGQLTLCDSQHGFLPALHPWKPNRRPDRGPHHTLTQAFLELDDPTVSPFLVHAQIYTWNGFYERDLIASYGARLPGSAPLWRALARRLIVAQIFLHSDHSARVTLTLSPDGRLRARIATNPQTPVIFATASARVAQGLRHAGLVPLTAARRMGAVGSSFHAGSTVPMRRDPHPGESDVLGRPYGLQRVHVVDASVLPAIPATTITFPVMANAHRIGIESG